MMMKTSGSEADTESSENVDVSSVNVGASPRPIRKRGYYRALQRKEKWAVDQNDFARWLSADPRFAPIGGEGYSHKETVHVIEVGVINGLTAELESLREKNEKLESDLQFARKFILHNSGSSLEYWIKDAGEKKEVEKLLEETATTPKSEEEK